MKCGAVLLFAAVLAGCSQAAPPAAAAAPPQAHYVAVLVAGDSSLPVFDHAVDRMAQLLRVDGTAPADIHILSAAQRPGARLATRAGVLDTIAALRPAPGQSCFLFLTSHGAHGEGLYLSPRTEFIGPAALDRALQAGCGGAPTVAIVSACYSGGFAKPPMARPNRVLLTAARADRPSFGCGAGRDLTFYDSCLLQSLTSLPAAWDDVIAGSRGCVARLEAEEGEPASDPQSFVGDAAAGSALPAPP